MADNTPHTPTLPGDDAGRSTNPEQAELSGPLDRPQQWSGENFSDLNDMMLARRSVAIRHLVPDAEQEQGSSAQKEIREATGESTPSGGEVAGPSVSIFRKRLRKFKALKRGYWSFLLLSILYVLSFGLKLLVNDKALAVHYNGSYYFPVFTEYTGKNFDLPDDKLVYRDLKEKFKADGGDNWALMPLYPWSPYESDFVNGDEAFQPPGKHHIFGTDDTGRDIFARLCYGFNISISFALVLTVIEYLIGIILGGLMGYFGGWTDLIGQRIVEIWSNIPFLFTVIIISSIIIPSFFMLILILSFFLWISTSEYMRGEFYREKGKDYVAAAIALGATDRQIAFKHILPNSLTPLVAFLPFNIIGGISALVSLDYLGFGLPPPTPSWGQMLDVGLSNLDKWWLVAVPVSAMFITLLLVTFIGEAIREAFDPRVYSRLR